MSKKHKKGEYWFYLKMANRCMQEIKQCGPDDYQRMLLLKSKMAKYVDRAKCAQHELRK